MSMNRDKVVLSCALTGAVTTKKHCPAIPYTPVEIAEEALRAYEAGAAIVHVHARTDEGAPTWEADTFRRIKEEIQARCPVLHQLVDRRRRADDLAASSTSRRGRTSPRSTWAR